MDNSTIAQFTGSVARDSQSGLDSLSSQMREAGLSSGAIRNNLSRVLRISANCEANKEGEGVKTVELLASEYQNMKNGWSAALDHLSSNGYETSQAVRLRLPSLYDTKPKLEGRRTFDGPQRIGGRSPADADRIYNG